MSSALEHSLTIISRDESSLLPSRVYQFPFATVTNGPKLKIMQIYFFIVLEASCPKSVSVD